jgi:MFS superfamily sulfate permease-like transporter
MIAEIVRSTANVAYGAQTWRSNFVHGITVLLAVVFFSSSLNLIPLSALAAVLLIVGSRLGSPAHFKHAMEVGKDNVVGFVVTMVVTLSVDLLVGIFAGAIAQFITELILGLKLRQSFTPEFSEVEFDKTEEDIFVTSALTFSNFLPIKEEIIKFLDKGMNVKLDLTESSYIDCSVIEQIEDLKKDFELKSLKLTSVFSEAHHAMGHDHYSSQKKAA